LATKTNRDLFEGSALYQSLHALEMVPAHTYLSAYATGSSNSCALSESGSCLVGATFYCNC